MPCEGEGAMHLSRVLLTSERGERKKDALSHMLLTQGVGTFVVISIDSRVSKRVKGAHVTLSVSNIKEVKQGWQFGLLDRTSLQAEKPTTFLSISAKNNIQRTPTKTGT